MSLVRQGILWSEIIAIFRRGSGIGSTVSSLSDLICRYNLYTRKWPIMELYPSHGKKANFDPGLNRYHGNIFIP